MSNLNTQDLSDAVLISDFTTAIANDPSKHFTLIETIGLLHMVQDFRIVMPEKYLHLVQTAHTVDHKPKSFGDQYTESVLISKQKTS